MKKIKFIGLLTLIAFISVLFVSNTKSGNSNEDPSITLNAYEFAVDDSAHVCNTMCAPGKHHFKHGEKGHSCSAQCMKDNKKKADLKDHKCSSECKSGKHAFSHGEKGHKCSTACKTEKSD